MRRFAPAYGPLTGIADHSPDSLAALAALGPPGSVMALMLTEAIPALPGTTVIQRDVCDQMIAERPLPPAPAFAAEVLGDADGPEMLALATLTKPGPFAHRTHQLGDFVGVRQGGVLVAMAGERMRPPGFTEVSAVCTHPDHRGHGYAGRLMRLVMAGIVARGETPFLHVFEHNTGAIALYKALGFALRRRMALTVLRRD